MSANLDCARLFKAELGAVLLDVDLIGELAAGGGDGTYTLEQAMQGLFGHVDELRTAARQRAASLTPGDRNRIDAWLVEFLTACNGIKREAKDGRLLSDDAELIRRLAGQGIDRAEAVVECSEPAARANGPEDPHFFWWQGKPHVLELPPKQWALLRCIWPTHEKTPLETIGAEVWGDKYKPYSAIKWHVNQINRAFERLGTPHRWEKSGDFLVRI